MTSSQFARKNAARLLLATALLALGVQPFANAQDEPAASASASTTQPGASPTATVDAKPIAGSPSETAKPGAKATEKPDPEPDRSQNTATPGQSVESESPEPATEQVPQKNVGKTPNGDGAPSARLASPGCPPKDRSSSVTSVTVSPVIVSPNDIVNVNFTAVLRNGGCEGDFIDIAVPPQLAGLTGTFPITAPDGSVIALMVVSAGHALITFNDYLEFNTNVSFIGRLKARVRVSVEPDTDYDLEWNAGNTVFVTPITTVPCPNCGPGQVRTRKFAEYEAGPPPFVRFAISSVATQTANEVITFTDTVDAGHEIDCSQIGMLRGNTVDAWGNIQFNQNVPNFTVVSCNTTTMTVRVTATAVGQYYRLEGRSSPTVVQPLYSDSATVNQAGVTTAVRASARLTDGGGEVDGTRRVPKVKIEKWSTVDGPKAGDYDDEYKNLNSGRDEKISFTVKNTGNEILNNIEVSDKTIDGKGTVRGLTCDFSALGGPSKGTSWAGPFDIGDSFTCRGKLPALGKNAKHTDRAKVVAFGRATTTRVTDTDDWNGKTKKGGNPPPGVDIEKWSTDDGPRAGDYDNASKPLTTGETEDLTFRIKNKSTEPLIDIVVRDRVFVGSATVDSLTCDFSKFGGPSSGTKWAGPLPVGKAFTCTATLSALKAGDQHADRAIVTAIGENSGMTTTDTDEWHARVGSPALPSVGLNSAIAPTAGIGVLLALTGVWLMRRRSQEN